MSLRPMNRHLSHFRLPDQIGRPSPTSSGFAKVFTKIGVAMISPFCTFVFVAVAPVGFDAVSFSCNLEPGCRIKRLDGIYSSRRSKGVPMIVNERSWITSTDALALSPSLSVAPVFAFYRIASVAVNANPITEAVVASAAMAG